MKTWPQLMDELAALRAIAADADRAGAAARVAKLHPLSRLIYDALACAADAGTACPNNAALAAMIGRSTAAASRHVSDLAELGIIRLAKKACAREVTIVATGRRTATNRRPMLIGRPDAPKIVDAPSASMPIEKPDSVPAPPPPRIMRHVVDRTPCFRCGVRGDIGCAHQQPQTFEMAA